MTIIKTDLILNTENSFEQLLNLPQTKGRMFLNSIYTDGITCRVSFARNNPRREDRETVTLNVGDFSQREISQYFRPCTLDPGRRDAFVAYYGNNEVRTLSTTEYYSGSGSPNRSRKEIALKAEQGIQALETNIPTPKTSNINQYIDHLLYIMLHLPRFFGFYNFRTAQINWNNYRGRQCALEEACNILLNGGKYNRTRRKKTRSNRRRRKKMVNRRRQGDNADNPIEIR